MKKIILTLSLAIVTSVGMAQGWVFIINDPSTAIYTNTASCQAGGARGLTPGNMTYIYRLFTAPYGTTDPEAFEDASAGAIDGFWPGGVYASAEQVPNWSGGVRSYLIRGWSVNLGYDWQTVNHWRTNAWQGVPANSFYGESEIGYGAPYQSPTPGLAIFGGPTGITKGFDLYACCHPMLPPSNATGPTNVTVPPGGTATFTVNASGAFLRYAWFKGATPLTNGPTRNGSTCSGAQSAALVISNVAPTDAVPPVNGFICRITNSSGAIYSTRVGLAVELPTSNLVIYADQLRNGFDDWSWSCVRNWAASDPHSGFNSVYFSPVVPYGALWLHHTDIDTSGYSSLSFWIKGEDVNGQELQVMGRLGASWQTALPLSILADGVWQKVTMSLADLGLANKTNFNGFAIQDGGSAEGSSYFVDDVQLDSAFTDGRPVIAGQPLSQNVPAGSNATFNVLASGFDPLIYRWRLNNTNVAAATNTSLVVSNVQPAKTGAYTVVVSNSVGSVTSLVATLNMEVPLTIVVNDGSMGVISGQFGFNISGNPGQVVVVDGSDDLVHWTALCTNTLGSGLFYFSDSQSANMSSRFYRVRLQ